MRGKGKVFEVRAAVFGITPAYAEKSAEKKLDDIWERDHPRLCGEKP